MPGRLTTLQDNIAAALAATSEIAGWGLQIITSRNGAIESQVETALAGLTPAIVVYPPSARSTKINPSCPNFDRVSITIRVVVNPGNFAATATDVAELVARRLHHASIVIDPSMDPQKPVRLYLNDAGESILPIDDPANDEVAVLFFTQFGLQPYPQS